MKDTNDFNFKPKKLAAHVALPATLAKVNQERAEMRRMLEFSLLKKLTQITSEAEADVNDSDV